MAKTKKPRQKIRLAPHNFVQCDYDYLNKLSYKERAYIEQFNDEYYNARYLPKDVSLYRSEKGLEVLKNDPEEYTMFLFELEIERESDPDISDLDMYVLLMQRQSSRDKYRRSVDYYYGQSYEMQKTENKDKTASGRLESHIDFSGGDFNRGTTELVDFEIQKKQSEKNPELDVVYKYLKEGRIQCYVALKLMEMVDELDTLTRKNKADIIDKIEEEDNKFKAGGLDKSAYSSYLFKIFTALRLLFKNNEDTMIVYNIFDKIIYVQNRKKMTELNQ